MNYLDLLPNDITKIINRKVQDLHIIERRKERKENRKMNREQEQKANRRRYIYNKYVNRGLKLRFSKLPSGYKDAGEYFLDSNKTFNDFQKEIESIIPMEW
jgi:hypothetical protein